MIYLIIFVTAPLFSTTGQLEPCIVPGYLLVVV